HQLIKKKKKKKKEQSLLTQFPSPPPPFLLKQARATQICGNPSNATPWFRAYSPSVVDHFYTASQSENQNSFRLGYNDEGIAAYVFRTSQPGTVPLYRLYSASGT